MSKIPMAAMQRKIAGYVEREVKRTIRAATSNHIQSTGLYRSLARRLRECRRSLEAMTAARDSALRERASSVRATTRVSKELADALFRVGVVEAERDRMGSVVDAVERAESLPDNVRTALAVYHAKVRAITGEAVA